MAKHTHKNPAIDALLTAVTGVCRINNIEADVCGFCGQPADNFRDEESQREFAISGMCQACQDRIFG